MSSTNPTSPTKRYVNAFFDDASECLLIWKDTCAALLDSPLELQPRLGWETLHLAIERLVDGSKRVDFFDLAQFLQTMLESVAMIRDGLLPPNRLVLETLNQTHGVVDNWIRNLFQNNLYLPASDLVRLAAETTSQVLLRDERRQTLPVAPNYLFKQIDPDGDSNNELKNEVAALVSVSEKQSNALVALDLVVTKLNGVTERVESLRLSNGASKQLPSIESGTPFRGVDRETIAAFRGKIIKAAHPSAYVVLKIGTRLFATKAADIAPIVQSEDNKAGIEISLADFSAEDVPTILVVDSVEGFSNISEDHIDCDVVVSGVIPRKWNKGIVKWSGYTVSVVDLKGYLREVARTEGESA